MPSVHLYRSIPSSTPPPPLHDKLIRGLRYLVHVRIAVTQRFVSIHSAPPTETTTKPTPPRTQFKLLNMGKKRVLVSYGVDIDAVAGWLGSYGGQDSTSDVRTTSVAYIQLLLTPRSSTDIPRSLRRHHRCATPPQTLRKTQHQSDLVHSRPLPRNLP